MSEHEHVFRRAQLTYDDGSPLLGGRRCACGVEVVGDGLLALNANVVRAGRNFNLAMTNAMLQIANAMEASRKRRFP